MLRRTILFYFRFFFAIVGFRVYPLRISTKGASNAYVFSQ